jgi:hypothetical protein
MKRGKGRRRKINLWRLGTEIEKKQNQHTDSEKKEINEEER